jgi:hypothetical protein
MTDPQIIPLHPDFRSSVELIGVEKEPVVVIDNFVQQPEALVDYACGCKFTQDTGFYPGLRAPCPLGYLKTLYAHLSGFLADIFQLPPSDIEGISAFFAIVTTPPEKLAPQQRKPHYDVPYKTGIAMIHYLCPDSYSGTSFYRHRETGYEFVDKARSEHYLQSLLRQVREQGLPQAYINGDTELFQRIASYGVAFNRILIYRSSSLHSGDIPPDYRPDPNPKTGRLTITSFIQGKT